MCGYMYIYFGSKSWGTAINAKSDIYFSDGDCIEKASSIAVLNPISRILDASLSSKQNTQTGRHPHPRPLMVLVSMVGPALHAGVQCSLV